VEHAIALDQDPAAEDAHGLDRIGRLAGIVEAEELKVIVTDDGARNAAQEDAMAVAGHLRRDADIDCVAANLHLIGL